VPEAGKRPEGRLRVFGATLAVVVVLASLTASPALAVPADFWGVVSQSTPTAEQFQRLKKGGVDSIRVPIAWEAVQPAKGGPLSWSGVDAMVKGAENAGLDVLPFVYGAPRWAVPSDRTYHSPRFLPVRTGAQRSGWSNLLKQAVLRYGPNGSFWADNPAVPKHPFRTWQIWNEENFEYFVARPNPAEYGKLVKNSYAAIKGADRGAKLILGGMFSRPNEATRKHGPKLAYFAADFLERMYKQTPGIRSKFQGVALHPYTTNYKRLTPYIEEFRSALKAGHDAGKGLWITELGWSSGHPTSNNHFAKGVAGQATQLKGAFKILSSHQRRWHLQRIYWFSVDDQAGACNFCDGSGLFGEGFLPKPAWFEYVRFAGGNPN
jgi:hypothetical protein